MRKVLVDTNVFIRFLLNDIPAQVEKAEELFYKAKKGIIEIIIPEIVIFEIEFILSKYYGLPKTSIVEKINSILSQEYFTVEYKNVFLKSIAIYQKEKLSLVDCFLLAKANIEELELFTFDKKIKRQI